MEDKGDECCDPGIGFVPNDTEILHIALMKGNTFYTWKEAFNFALKRKGGSVISTPVAIAFIIFFTALGGVVIGLLGRIPYVGEVGFSLFAIIWFMASLFLVFVILALVVSFLLTPAILRQPMTMPLKGFSKVFP